MNIFKRIISIFRKKEINNTQLQIIDKPFKENCSMKSYLFCKTNNTALFVEQDKLKVCKFGTEVSSIPLLSIANTSAESLFGIIVMRMGLGLVYTPATPTPIPYEELEIIMTFSHQILDYINTMTDNIQ